MTRLSNVAVGGKATASNENSDRAGINRTMQLMTPTSVSAGSIGTYGAVTVSAVSAVSLNGCFTSEFDWYIVEYNFTSSGAALLGLTLRLSGTDSTTGYDNQRVSTVNTTSTPAQSLNAASFNLAAGSGITGTHFGTVKLYNPFLAVQTTGKVSSGIAANPMTTTAAQEFTNAISHRSLVAYDGLTVTPSTGTITGTIRVYGII